MKTGVTVTIELDVPDAQEASRFEEKLLGWLRHQGPVTAVSTSSTGVGNDVAWRESRKETFGERLPNPFAPGRSAG